jgi:mannose-6-phosphate isomerase-like protein (cupin superfamily)
VSIIDQTALPSSGTAYELEGYLHDDVAVSIIIVDAPPGKGPSLHKHPYEEIFIVQEGRATFVLGNEEVEVSAGQIVIGPAEVPHRWVNPGPGRLRQVDIHASPRFITEWLDS